VATASAARVESQSPVGEKVRTTLFYGGMAAELAKLLTR
jgi:hypothetical protein